MKVSCKPTCRHMDIDCKKNITFSVDESNMTVTQSSGDDYLCAAKTPRAESGGWLLGRGSHPFPHQLGGLGKRYKLPSDPAAKWFSLGHVCNGRCNGRAGGRRLFMGGSVLVASLVSVHQKNITFYVVQSNTAVTQSSTGDVRQRDHCYIHMCLQCVHWRCCMLNASAMS